MNKPIDPNLDNLMEDNTFSLSDGQDKDSVTKPQKKENSDGSFDDPDFTVNESADCSPEDYYASKRHRTRAEDGSLSDSHRRDDISSHHNPSSRSSSGRSSNHHSSSRSSNRSSHQHSPSRSSRSRSSRHSSSKRKKTKKPLAVRILLGVLAGILALVLLVVGTFFALDYMGKKNIKDTTIIAEAGYEETIEYNGHTYVYNNDIVSVAFIGVDKRALGKEDSHTKTVGMADANVVFAVDTVSGKTSMIAVPRDTMVDVNVYKDNKFQNTTKMQLCIAYAYGDGFETSCRNVTTSISRILYSVPINKYFSMDLDGIKPLNDAIGGVTVSSLYELDEYGIKVGDTVHLKGDLTEKYVRTRDMDNVEASLNRTKRQVQYLKAFTSQLKGAVVSDFGVISNLYSTASDYCTTDITLSNATYMASLILSKGSTDFDSYTLEGEMKPMKNAEFKDDVYAAFYPDEDKLLQTVLDVFYTKVK